MLRPLLHLIFVVLNDYLVAGGTFVRLVDGLDTCSGRVEVLFNKTWMTVNGDSWNINAAAVVCRELGCGRAVTAHKQALFGEGSGPIHDVSCEETEYSLMNCSHQQCASNDCSHSQDAGVVCSASLVFIIGAVISAVVLLLSATVIIILVVRRKKRKMLKIQKSSGGAVNMLEVPHEDRYKESNDEADYERVDVEEDNEDLNSDSDQDYVNINEPKQANETSEQDDSDQDYVNVDEPKQANEASEQDDSDQDYVNVETEVSEQNNVNVESDDSDQDYVNVNITEP